LYGVAVRLIGPLRLSGVELVPRGCHQATIELRFATLRNKPGSTSADEELRRMRDRCEDR
jgi:hypothetical protein